MISYSGNFEDVLLNRLFRDKRPGFYVDIGAHHPIFASNTHHFYLLGWRGINVEPTSYFTHFPKIRPEDVNLKVAVSNSCGTINFRECTGQAAVSQVDGVANEHIALANIKREIFEIETRTLASILQENSSPEIDFLSIDVEGHEKQVIEGNDWDRFRPRLLLIESTFPFTNTLCHHDWEPILLENGYLFAHFDGVNRFYVRDDQSKLYDLLQVPLNVLDYFETYETVELRKRVAELEAKLTTNSEHQATSTLSSDSHSRKWYSRLAMLLKRQRAA